MRADAQKPKAAELRSLVIVLGDSLDMDAAGFDGFGAAVDANWMTEASE